jgi:hypothetical protein
VEEEIRVKIRPVMKVPVRAVLVLGEVPIEAVPGWGKLPGGPGQELTRAERAEVEDFKRYALNRRSDE